MRKVILAMIAVGISYQPAQAHWQKTRWGMTIDQAARAVGQPNPTVEVHEGSRTKNFQFPYVAGRNEFVARLIFGGPNFNLETVILKLKNGFSCILLESDLTKVYGPPDEKSNIRDSFYYNWYVKSKGEKITFFGSSALLSPSCSVQYEPLQPAGQSGL